MGLFFSSDRFTRPGPGVRPDAPRKKGVARLAEIMGRDMWNFFRAGFLAFLGCLPFIIGMFFAVETHALLFMLLAGIIGFIIGVPVLRLRGDYLAIVTLAFGEIMKNIFGNLYLGIDETGLHATMSSAGLTLGAGGQMIVSGPRGATGITKLSTFAVGFVLILFTLFVVQNLINSREGRAIKAVRDNRIAAESVGINVTAFRMKAFVVSAFLAGMAGALYAMNYGSITATKFNFNTSINILVFVVLGGMGNILGSIISATVLYILPEAMRGLQDYRMILYAVVLIVVMLFTWSPKVKEAMSVVTDKIAGAFKKKEAGSNE